MYEFKIGNVVKVMEKDAFETAVNYHIEQHLKKGILYENLNELDVLKDVLEVQLPEGKYIEMSNEAKGYVYQQIMVKGHTMKHSAVEKMA